MMNIGSKIKSIRELKNYTQSHMAKELGLSQKAYSNIETNITDITVSRLEEIAKVLDVSLTQILNLSEENIFQNIFNNRDESQNTYTINNNHANEKLELYEKIVAEKEAHIQTLQELLKRQK